MRTFIVAALLGVLVVVACGDGEEAPPATGEAPSPTGAAESPVASPASPTVPGTAAPRPTFTPIGTVEAQIPLGKIVFTSWRDGNQEVYMLTPEGEVNLTNDPAEDIEPGISWDGTKVAFASDRDGVYHLYAANVDGSGLVKLTSDSVGDFSPRWSPDGSQIAFSRAGAIMVMNSDGTNIREVTKPEPESTAAPCKAGGFLGGWSPDGERLTFYAASVSRSIGQVCTVNVDGSDLTVVASEPPGYHVEPSWSPEDEWIVYRFIRDENHEIYAIKADGTSSENLTDNPATDIEPAWSPDGEWIVFSSDRGGNFDLHIMRRDGSDVARVTTSGAKDSDPTWGP